MDYILKAYFVDETWLKEKTPINATVDTEELVPFIGSAQDLWIQPILGTKLYNRLMDGIVAGDLTAAETTLLKIIRPVLAYYTVYVAIPYLGVQIRRAGIVRQKNENVDPANVQEMNILRNEAKNTAEFYAQRLTDWLCDNQSSFSAYMNNSVPIFPDRTNKFNGGFYYDGMDDVDWILT